MVITEQDERAVELVKLRDRELARQGPFRDLWQSIANVITPFMNPITEVYAPGAELMEHIFDPTPMMEAENMASGLLSNLMPPGQQFFALRPIGMQFAENYQIQRYFSILSEGAHEAMVNSNLIEQISNTLESWVNFGTGSIYSEWTVKTGLNYRDYGIGTFQCREDSQGNIDTMIITEPMTPRQCVEKWGLENVGEKIKTYYENPEKRDEPVNIIHICRPRQERDAYRIDSGNMPYESIYVAEDDKVILEEGGFEEFSFAVPRYRVLCGEVYGRGQGAVALKAVRVLHRSVRDHMELCNKYPNPPLEVLESFDGDVDVRPGGENRVIAMNSIQGIPLNRSGDYPVSKDWLENWRMLIGEIFHKSAFQQLSMLTGDRRTTLEIAERVKESMKRLSRPMGRLFRGLFDPLIIRSVRLLVRNGMLPPPPPELRGVRFKVEYLSPLALALRDQQARGLQYWIAAVGEAEPLFPGVKDNVNSDQAFRDLGAAFGVKTAHIRPTRERDEIRAERLKLQQEQQAMEELSVASQAYGQGTKAPEVGSAADRLLGGSNA